VLSTRRDRRGRHLLLHADALAAELEALDGLIESARALARSACALFHGWMVDGAGAVTLACPHGR
jgi:hypothetical protein